MDYYHSGTDCVEKVIEVLYHPYHGNIFVYLRNDDYSVFGCGIIERAGFLGLETKESLQAYLNEFHHAFGTTQIPQGIYEPLDAILNITPPAVYNIAQIAST